MKIGPLDHIGVAMSISTHFVTPAKAGANHLWLRLHRWVMDSRLRGNNELVRGNAIL